jgi:hypothetical protein
MKENLMSASNPKKRAPHRKGAPATRKKPGSRHWILVADHKKAHVYRKSPQGIERIPDEHLHVTLPLPREEADDQAFLRDIASWLDVAEKEDAFDRIALIASPSALEALHGMVGEGVHCRICAATAWSWKAFIAAFAQPWRMMSKRLPMTRSKTI